MSRYQVGNSIIFKHPALYGLRGRLIGCEMKNDVLEFQVELHTSQIGCTPPVIECSESLLLGAYAVVEHPHII